MPAGHSRWTNRPGVGLDARRLPSPVRACRRPEHDRHSGVDLVPAAGPLFVDRHIVRKEHPWVDRTHVSAQYVVEGEQLANGVPPELGDLGDAGYPPW